MPRLARDARGRVARARVRGGRSARQLSAVQQCVVDCENFMHISWTVAAPGRAWRESRDMNTPYGAGLYIYNISKMAFNL